VEAGRNRGLRSTLAGVAASPKVRAGLSFPFRLGPATSNWRDRPFFGLAAVHNVSGAGDALVTVALAGSVFASVSLNAARGRTALGLLCTVLPFAVVGPFVGPAIDRMRGGRRFILFLAAAGRVAACVLMAAWVHSLLLFPAAFLSLVCSKTHAVAKAALVPAVVDHQDDLVRANSRLALGSSLSTSVAAGIGGGIYKLFGSRALLEVDALVFATCAVLAIYLLRVVGEPAGVPELRDSTVQWAVKGSAPGPDRVSARWVPGTPWPAEGSPAGYGAGAGAGGSTAGARWSSGGHRSQARSTGRGVWGRGRPAAGARRAAVVPRELALAQLAMAGMRATSGFLTLLVIFGFRRQGAALYWYGLVGAATVAGNFGGALLAPRLRSHVTERRLVGGSALMIAGTAVAVSFVSSADRRLSAVVLALVVALGASLAKTAFDAIVQRDTLDLDRSRLFARFESIFQLVWVLGALFPTVVPTPLLAGYIMIAGVVVATSAGFVSGLAREAGVVPTRPIPAGAPASGPAEGPAEGPAGRAANGSGETATWVPAGGPGLAVFGAGRRHWTTGSPAPRFGPGRTVWSSPEANPGTGEVPLFGGPET
jgi:hypothetical protein